MKIVWSIVIFLAGCLQALAQTTVLADNPDDGCKIKFEKIKVKIDDRRRKYEFNVQEYKDGLFCSECRRTKSEIEERVNISFAQHIKDGAAHNRHAIATRQMYDDLYTEYMTDFNRFKEEYDDKYNDCGGDAAQIPLQTITNQQLQLYTSKLSGDTSFYNSEVEVFRIDYNFYYAWAIRISIVKWQIISGFETIQVAKKSYRRGMNSTSNSITQAGNMLNNYLNTLADKQQAGFLNIGLQSPVWPLKGVLVAK